MCAVRFATAGDNFTRTADLLNYNAAYSYCGWFYVDATASFQIFLGIQFNDFNNQDNYQRDGGTSALTLQIWSGGGSTTAAGGALSNSTWYHFAVVRESTTVIKAYRNGVLDCTVNRDISARTAANKMGVGDFGGAFLDGRVFAMKAWTVALTADEVANEMQIIRPQRTDSLYAWWPMVENTASTYRSRDFSTNLRHWTEAGTPADIAGPPVSWGASVLYVQPTTAAAVTDISNIAAHQMAGADGSGYLGHRVLSY